MRNSAESSNNGRGRKVDEFQDVCMYSIIGLVCMYSIIGLVDGLDVVHRSRR